MREIEFTRLLKEILHCSYSVLVLTDGALEIQLLRIQTDIHGHPIACSGFDECELSMAIQFLEELNQNESLVVDYW